MPTRPPYREILAQAAALERDLEREKARLDKGEQPKAWAGITVALLAGAAMAAGIYRVGAIAWEYSRMQTWVATPAFITELELYDGGSRTRSLFMRYRYEIDGRACVGGRVNIGDDAGISYDDRFREAFRTKTPITVWADRSANCRSIVDPAIPLFRFVMSVVWIVAGLVAIVHVRNRGWKLVP
jgi:hypothetical protein